MWEGGDADGNGGVRPGQQAAYPFARAIASRAPLGIQERRCHANAATRDGQVAALSPLEGRAKWGCGEVLCDPDGAGLCGVRGTGIQPSRGGPQRRSLSYCINRASLSLWRHWGCLLPSTAACATTPAP